jgi:hypothetical protein
MTKNYTVVYKAALDYLDGASAGKKRRPPGPHSALLC